jgi:hypothetical protein
VSNQLVANPNLFSHLDVAQLCKHYLGMRNTFSGRNIQILYLFWEPRNANVCPVFQVHRKELERFAKAVNAKTERFHYMSYTELWESWSGIGELKQHLANLRARYLIDL